MVVVGGRLFQVRDNGFVREVADEVMTPYATVTRFRPDAETVLKRCSHLNDLTEALDRTDDRRRWNSVRWTLPASREPVERTAS